MGSIWNALVKDNKNTVREQKYTCKGVPHNRWLLYSINEYKILSNSSLRLQSYRHWYLSQYADILLDHHCWWRTWINSLFVSIIQHFDLRYVGGYVHEGNFERPVDELDKYPVESSRVQVKVYIHCHQLYILLLDTCMWLKISNSMKLKLYC